MKPSDMADILTTTLATSWPSFPVTEATVRLWCESFPNLDKETFWEVIKATLKTHTGNFPPTIGQVTATLQQMTTTDEPTEGELWEILMSAVKSFGSYGPDKAREYIRKRGGERLVLAVRCMGWQEVCLWLTADEAANRAHFWRVYSGLKNRDEFQRKVGRESIDAVAPQVSQITADLVKRLEA